MKKDCKANKEDKMDCDDDCNCGLDCKNKRVQKCTCKKVEVRQTKDGKGSGNLQWRILKKMNVA